VREAEEELAVAVRIASEPDLPGRVACFHAHLAAEKAIKSLQIRQVVPVRRSTIPSSSSESSRPTTARRSLAQISTCLTRGRRYPADHETVGATETKLAVDAAKRLLAAVRALQLTGDP
jgi:HEPN domain-containing protein